MDADVDRLLESRLEALDRFGSVPPKPLGNHIFEDWCTIFVSTDKFAVSTLMSTLEGALVGDFLGGFDTENVNCGGRFRALL